VFVTTFSTRARWKQRRGGTVMVDVLDGMVGRGGLGSCLRLISVDHMNASSKLRASLDDCIIIPNKVRILFFSLSSLHSNSLISLICFPAKL
jgi:hypothetical protein